MICTFLEGDRMLACFRKKGCKEDLYGYYGFFKILMLDINVTGFCEIQKIFKEAIDASS